MRDARRALESTLDNLVLAAHALRELRDCDEAGQMIGAATVAKSDIADAWESCSTLVRVLKEATGER